MSAPQAPSKRATRGWIAAAAASWRPILLTHAAVLVLCAAGVPRLGLDNSPSVFFVEDAAELERYRELQHLFGRDHLLRVVARGPGLWTEAGTEWLARVEQELASVQGVLGAAGLWTHHRLLPLDGSGAVESEPEPRSGWPPGTPDALRRRAVDDPLDRAAGWVSEDGDVATILVILYDLPPVELRRTVEALRAAVEVDRPTGVDPRVVGLPALAAALDRDVLDIGFRTFPLLLVVAVTALAIALRGLGDLLAPLLFVGFVETTVLGLMGFADIDLNVVLTILVPLVFVIPLATALYLLVELRHQRRTVVSPGQERSTAKLEDDLSACYRERGWPVLWAGFTTAAAFGSLALSALPPVRTLGAWTAGGIAFATAEAFLLYPALLRAFASAQRTRPSRPWLEEAGRWLGRSLAATAVAHRGVVIAAFVLAALGAGLLLPGLEIGPGPLDLFAPSDPVRAEIEALEARGIAVVSDEVVVTSTPSTAGLGTALEGFATPDALRRLDDVAIELRSSPGVLSVLTPFDLAAAAVRARRSPVGGQAGDDPPPTDAELLDGLAAYRQRSELDGLLSAMLTREGEAARLSVMVPMRGLDELEPVFERAETAVRARFPEARVFSSGVYPLVIAGRRTILESMASSLVLTLAVVAALFGLVVRSARGLLACLAPNLFAVLVVLGLMAATSTPVDSTTLMIVAVVLGLAVDDTLHTLGAFRRRARGRSSGAAAIAALEHTTPGHLLTTVTLVGGFAMCGLSGFVPVARFGLLTAAALVLALLADLLLTPALLASLGPRHLSALGPRAATLET